MTPCKTVTSRVAGDDNDRENKGNPLAGRRGAIHSINRHAGFATTAGRSRTGMSQTLQCAGHAEDQIGVAKLGRVDTAHPRRCPPGI